MAKVIITIEDTKEDSVIASAEVTGEDKASSGAVLVAEAMLSSIQNALPDEAMKEITDEEHAALQGTPQLNS